MARPSPLYFDPHEPPAIQVPLSVSSVHRYSRQLFEICGCVGDYELVVRRPAAEVPQGPIMRTSMQVTRVQRFAGEKAVQVGGYVGDYEASIWLDSDDDRVRSLKRLHKLSQRRSVAGKTEWAR